VFEKVIKVYAKGVKEQFPDGGKMSQYLESLTVGKDTVDIKGPFGRVEYLGRGKFEIGKKPLPLKTHLGFMAVGPCPLALKGEPHAQETASKN
jgi:hypothetical protein